MSERIGRMKDMEAKIGEKQSKRDGERMKGED